MKAKGFALLLLVSWACTVSRDQSSQSPVDSLIVQDTIIVDASADSIKRVRDLDALGRYVAGLHQIDTNSFSALEKEPAWQNYRNFMDSNWNSSYKLRLSKMEEWQSENLSAKLNDTLTIFYPFSGPDFLHAYYLYPGARQYLLAALEPIQSAPLLDTLSAEYRGMFLDSLSHSLRDVFGKSFFITGTMKVDLMAMQGVLPTLYFFIERSGHELTSQDFFYLDSTGNEVPATIHELSQHKARYVQMNFRDRTTHAEKTLRYFSINLADPELNQTQEFETFLKRNGPFNTFIKSASYCMHQDNFEYIKKLVLENSISLFQDDTGVPYKAFRNKLDWNIQLYGEYTVPVIAFRDLRFQKDLDSAYRISTSKAPLPFSLGYHWVSKKQNYMLVRKSRIRADR